MDKLEKDIENLYYDLHNTYINLTAAKMVEVKSKLDILNLDIATMKRTGNFNNLQFYKDLLNDLDTFCKNFKCPEKATDFEKMQKILKENKQVGDYFTYIVFQLEDGKYYIYDKKFVVIPENEIKFIEFRK